jgi:MATE family multidrug resistance protein
MGRASDLRAELPGLFGLSLPIVAGMAASTLLGVTDVILLAPLGPVPMAGAGLGATFGIVVGAAVYGLISAVQVRIGTAVGARAGRSIPAILRSGLALGALAGVGGGAAMVAAWPLLRLSGQPDEVLAVLFPYWCLIAAVTLPFAMLTVLKSAFEAVGRPWTGTAFAYLGVVLNVPLSLLLIWGVGPVPPLGLTGAGIGTLAAEALALAAALAWWLRAPSMRRLRARGRPSGTEIAAAAREGAPMGLMYLAETAAMTAATLMIGTFGTVALAANQVAMSVGNVLYMLPLGIAQAVTIRIAQARGAGERRRLRAVAGAGLGLGTLWLSGAALFLAFAGGHVAGAITADPQVVAQAAAIMVVFALMQVFDGVQTAMVGALRGLSDTAFPALVTVAAYWGAGLPLGWVLAVHVGLGAPGVWLGWLGALAVAGALLTWRFRRATAAA